MVDDSHKFYLLKQRVEERFGSRPRTPNDFRTLSADIRDSVGHTLGVTTLKRLWGYISNSSRPTFSTLSILCRYVGFQDWDAFNFFCHNDEDSGFNHRKFVISDSLPLGARLRIKIGEDKECTIIKYAAPDSFEVLDSLNIKLLKGDRLMADTIVVGNQFVAKECTRAGEKLGAYTSSRQSTIVAIEML